MKAYFKFYLFYAAIFLIGASISAGLYFAYDLRIFPTDIFDVNGAFSFDDIISAASFLLKPLTVLFLSGFTLYACAVSGTICLYVGAVYGRFAIRYCLSSHSVFTHGASLILLIAVGTSFVIMSKEASVCRSYMKSTAPDPAIIIKAKSSISFLSSYLTACIALIATAIGTYMLTLYFKI